jgi:uracil-DNA glycosylase family 4
MIMHDKNWLLDQLKGHLEFMQEIGIDAVSPVRLEGLKKSVSKSATPRTAAPTLDAQPKRKRENAASVISPVPPLSQAGALVGPNYATLEAIQEEIGDCHRCKLCHGRTNIVFGSGNPRAKLVFVGEGPGADEDEQGLPFVGKAGQLLTKIIESIQMARSEVYICNVVKCRPPSNRVPEKEEIAACSPFMLGQLAVIRPRIICCLGATAAQTLLQTTAFMGKLRGRFYDFQGAQLIATYHPAYLLRNPAAKRDVWEDMKKIRALMDSEKQAGRW